MNISVCITVFNEEGTIAPLLDSLLNQSKKPDQIIIVDGGSNDRTVEIIRHYQRKDGRIKLLVEKCSRARGRNLSVEIAKGDIIAMTDAGCLPAKDWLKKLTTPFNTKKVDVSAGFYEMTGNSSLQKAESVFLGISPNYFDYDFLPSTRSVAFTKNAWELVGGFPEKLEGAAEDTVFNYKLIISGLKISRVKEAIVEWGMPKTIKEFFLKIHNYAKGDAQTKIWIFPKKGFASHNIKAVLILLRYLVGSALLFLSFFYPSLFYLLVFSILIYLIWAYRKIYSEFGDWKVSFWVPILQINSDIAVMGGFIKGFFGK